MSTTTTYQTIKILRSLFARYGIPDQVVSNNGPQFISSEFGEFMKNNGIKHWLFSLSSVLKWTS